MHRKNIFDAVRRMLGRGFTPLEIRTLDQAIDAAGGGGSVRHERPACGQSSTGDFAVSSRGLALIREFEGCAKIRADGLVEAYPDPGTGGPPWTIGWGATGPNIGPDTVWSREQCDARLEADVARHAAEVARALGNAPTTQAQFDALVSFHYNTGAIARATLTKRHREGNQAAAAHEFGRWNRAGGRVLAGLTRRRAAEAKLYSQG
jgi:GH24 family phage-related lysozyme (muramidase)